MLDTNFPNIVSRFQFFKEFTGNNINILNQIKYKEDFFNLFVGKSFKVSLNWTLAVLEMIENYFSRASKLAYMRTKSKLQIITD